MIDDVDPSIEWDPPTQWAMLGTYPEFQNTTHDTSVAGSTMKYKFSGTAVSVWGSVQTGLPSTSYAIDGGTPQVWAPPAITDKLYHTLFYASPNLTAGDHTLAVTVGNNSGPVIIDYLLVEAPPSTSTTTATSLPAGTSQPSSGAGSGSGSNSTSGSGSGSRTPIAAIAGGAVGGAVLIAALIAIFFYLFRRRRRNPAPRQYFDNESPVGMTSFFPAGDPVTVYEPHTQSRPAASAATSVTTEPDYHSSAPLTLSTQPPYTSHSSSMQQLHVASAESPSPSSSTFRGSNPQLLGERYPSKRQQPEPTPPPPPPRVHTDGGVRLDVGHGADEPEEMEAELPPVYGNYDA